MPCIKVIKTAVISISITGVFAAFDDPCTGVRPLGMGGAFTAVADDGNALFYNPAGLGQQHGTELGGSYFRPFGLKVLQSSVISLVQGTPYGTVGAGVKNFGQADYYKEETYMLSYGKEIFQDILVGASLRYLVLKITPLYGSDWCLSADWGVLWKASGKFRLGAFIRNLNLPHFSVDMERLPWVGSLGLAFYPRKDFIIAVDAHKNLQHPVQVKVGQEFRFLQYLLFRGGVQTNPARFTVGGGVQVSYIRADYVYYSHPVLGGSHQVSIKAEYNRQPGQAGP